MFPLVQMQPEFFQGGESTLEHPDSVLVSDTRFSQTEVKFGVGGLICSRCLISWDNRLSKLVGGIGEQKLLCLTPKIHQNPVFIPTSHIKKKENCKPSSK